MVDEVAEGPKANSKSKRPRVYMLVAVVVVGLVFMTLGGALALTGITLIELQELTNATRGITSLVFSGRGGGVVTGTLVAGLPKCPGGERFRALITGVVMFPTALVTAAIPWCHIIYLTIGIHFLQGYGIGYVKTSCTLLVIRQWDHLPPSVLGVLLTFFHCGCILSTLAAMVLLRNNHVNEVYNVTKECVYNISNENGLYNSSLGVKLINDTNDSGLNNRTSGEIYNGTSVVEPTNSTFAGGGHNKTNLEEPKNRTLVGRPHNITKVEGPINGTLAGTNVGELHNRTKPTVKGFINSRPTTRPENGAKVNKIVGDMSSHGNKGGIDNSRNRVSEIKKGILDDMLFLRKRRIRGINRNAGREVKNRILSNKGKKRDRGIHRNRAVDVANNILGDTLHRSRNKGNIVVIRNRRGMVKNDIFGDLLFSGNNGKRSNNKNMGGQVNNKILGELPLNGNKGSRGNNKNRGGQFNNKILGDLPLNVNKGNRGNNNSGGGPVNNKILGDLPLNVNKGNRGNNNNGGGQVNNKILGNLPLNGNKGSSSNNKNMGGQVNNKILGDLPLNVDKGNRGNNNNGGGQVNNKILGELPLNGNKGSRGNNKNRGGEVNKKALGDLPFHRNNGNRGNNRKWGDDVNKVINTNRDDNYKNKNKHEDDLLFKRENEDSKKNRASKNNGERNQNKSGKIFNGINLDGLNNKTSGSSDKGTNSGVVHNQTNFHHRPKVKGINNVTNVRQNNKTNFVEANNPTHIEGVSNRTNVEGPKNKTNIKGVNNKINTTGNLNKNNSEGHHNVTIEVMSTGGNNETHLEGLSNRTVPEAFNQSNIEGVNDGPKNGSHNRTGLGDHFNRTNLHGHNNTSSGSAVGTGIPCAKQSSPEGLGISQIVDQVHQLMRTTGIDITNLQLLYVAVAILMVLAGIMISLCFPVLSKVPSKSVSPVLPDTSCRIKIGYIASLYLMVGFVHFYLMQGIEWSFAGWMFTFVKVILDWSRLGSLGVMLMFWIIIAASSLLAAILVTIFTSTTLNIAGLMMMACGAFLLIYGATHVALVVSGGCVLALGLGFFNTCILDWVSYYTRLELRYVSTWVGFLSAGEIVVPTVIGWLFESYSVLMFHLLIAAITINAVCYAFIDFLGCVSSPNTPAWQHIGFRSFHFTKIKEKLAEKTD